MVGDGAAAERGNGTVSRAIHLLSAVADADGPIGVNELALRTGLPPSTVHRLLALLGDEDVVVRDPSTRTYWIGPELYRVSARVTSAVGAEKYVQPILDELADAFDETVVFARYSPGARSVIFVARADGQKRLQYRMDMQGRSSLIWGASGKAVAAFLPDDVLADVIAAEAAGPTQGRSPGHGGPLPPRDELAAEFVMIRDRGYAVTSGEKLPEAQGIAVPVRGRNGVLGSILLTYPRERVLPQNMDAVVRRLRDGADRMSRLFPV